MISPELLRTLERLRTACDDIERARAPLDQLAQKCLADGLQSNDVLPALTGFEQAMMKLLDQLIQSNEAFERWWNHSTSRRHAVRDKSLPG